ncbi:hypothetical protein V5O48_013126 [Marasmius crinis-equi]|uniref:Uncharacterized protein n=1 Tax=Marasmius crinis-equi TaxID=585013 RepID=A0ABR3F0X8_9AGAR
MEGDSRAEGSKAGEKRGRERTANPTDTGAPENPPNSGTARPKKKRKKKEPSPPPPPKKPSTVDPSAIRRKDLPKDGESTKRAYQIHLCVMMGLEYSYSLPERPSPEAKARFQERRKDYNEYIKEALAGKTQYQKESEARAEAMRQKLDKVQFQRQALRKVPQTVLEIICARLARLGMDEFTPDVTEDATSDWNWMCKVVAAETFKTACNIGLYSRWKPLQRDWTNTAFLEFNFDNYVFSYLRRKAIAGREKAKERAIMEVDCKRRKEKGTRRGTQAALLGYPLRVQRLVSNPGAVSDPEPVPGRKDEYYVVDKPERASRVTDLVRWLDNIKWKQYHEPRNKDDRPTQGFTDRIIRLVPETPIPPKGCLVVPSASKTPLNYYNPAWFNQQDTLFHLRRSTLPFAALPADISINDLFGGAQPHSAVKMTDEQFNQQHGKLALAPYKLPSAEEIEEAKNAQKVPKDTRKADRERAKKAKEFEDMFCGGGSDSSSDESGTDSAFEEEEDEDEGGGGFADDKDDMDVDDDGQKKTKGKGKGRPRPKPKPKAKEKTKEKTKEKEREKEKEKEKEREKEKEPAEESPDEQNRTPTPTPRQPKIEVKVDPVPPEIVFTINKKFNWTGRGGCLHWIAHPRKKWEQYFNKNWTIVREGPIGSIPTSTDLRTNSIAFSNAVTFSQPKTRPPHTSQDALLGPWMYEHESLPIYWSWYRECEWEFWQREDGTVVREGPRGTIRVRMFDGAVFFVGDDDIKEEEEEEEMYDNTIVETFIYQGSKGYRVEGGLKGYIMLCTEYGRVLREGIQGTFNYSMTSNGTTPFPILTFIDGRIYGDTPAPFPVDYDFRSSRWYFPLKSTGELVGYLLVPENNWEFWLDSYGKIMKEGILGSFPYRVVDGKLEFLDEQSDENWIDIPVTRATSPDPAGPTDQDEDMFAASHSARLSPLFADSESEEEPTQPAAGGGDDLMASTDGPPVGSEVPDAPPPGSGTPDAPPPGFEVPRRPSETYAGRLFVWNGTNVYHSVDLSRQWEWIFSEGGELLREGPLASTYYVSTTDPKRILLRDRGGPPRDRAPPVNPWTREEVEFESATRAELDGLSGESGRWIHNGHNILYVKLEGRAWDAWFNALTRELLRQGPTGNTVSKSAPDHRVLFKRAPMLRFVDEEDRELWFDLDSGYPLHAGGVDDGIFEAVDDTTLRLKSNPRGVGKPPEGAEFYHLHMNDRQLAVFLDGQGKMYWFREEDGELAYEGPENSALFAFNEYDEKVSLDVVPEGWGTPPKGQYAIKVNGQMLVRVVDGLEECWRDQAGNEGWQHELIRLPTDYQPLQPPQHDNSQPPPPPPPPPHPPSSPYPSQPPSPHPPPTAPSLPPPPPPPPPPPSQASGFGTPRNFNLPPVTLPSTPINFGPLGLSSALPPMGSSSEQAASNDSPQGVEAMSTGSDSNEEKTIDAALRRSESGNSASTVRECKDLLDRGAENPRMSRNHPLVIEAR